MTNLGAANPAAAARAARRLALELGISDVRVASVVGDDVSERVPEIAWTRPVEDGEWLGAHVYLGVEPIVAALAEGADVVITGRVADSSLFAAAPALRSDSPTTRWPARSPPVICSNARGSSRAAISLSRGRRTSRRQSSPISATQSPTWMPTATR